MDSTLHRFSLASGRADRRDEAILPTVSARASAQPARWLPKQQQRHLVAIRVSDRGDVTSKAVAERMSGSEEGAARFKIEVDNDADETSTVIRVTGLNRPGLLTALTKTFQNLDLDVNKVSLYVLLAVQFPRCHGTRLLSC